MTVPTADATRTKRRYREDTACTAMAFPPQWIRTDYRLRWSKARWLKVCMLLVRPGFNERLLDPLQPGGSRRLLARVFPSRTSAALLRRFRDALLGLAA